MVVAESQPHYIFQALTDHIRALFECLARNVVRYVPCFSVLSAAGSKEFSYFMNQAFWLNNTDCDSSVWQVAEGIKPLVTQQVTGYQLHRQLHKAKKRVEQSWGKHK